MLIIPISIPTALTAKVNEKEMSSVGGIRECFLDAICMLNILIRFISKYCRITIILCSYFCNFLKWLFIMLVTSA